MKINLDVKHNEFHESMLNPRISEISVTTHIFMKFRIPSSSLLKLAGKTHVPSLMQCNAWLSRKSIALHLNSS